MAKKLTKKQQFYKEISDIVKSNTTRPTYKDIIEHLDEDINSFLKTQNILKKMPKDKEISTCIYCTFLNLKLEDENFVKRASSINDLIYKLENFFRGLMTYGTCAYASSISDILEYKDFVVEKELIPMVKKAYYKYFPEQKEKNDLLEQIMKLLDILKISYDKDIEEIKNIKVQKLKELTNDFDINELVRLEVAEKFMDKIWIKEITKI